MHLRRLTLVYGWIVLQASTTDARPSKASTALPCVYIGQLCTYDVLNFSSDAIGRLRALQLINSSLIQVEVKRLISPRPDGELLQFFSYFTDYLHYTTYYETVLRIPAECELQALEVKSARQLQMIAVFGSNAHLRLLIISIAAMRRIPRSLQNLSALTHFVATDGQLELVNLEAFRSLANLVTVVLKANKIRVLEISTDPELNVAVQDLVLSYNELEFVDMEFFVPLRRLKFVDLHSNRIKQIVKR
uniref:Uncharacterized protein n=1 Tax=Anopheles albimanus TaxID=7167 RepID=A0A182FF20_ANOAL